MTKPLTYLKTHPWIKYALDLNHFGANLWMLLGEAKSKCDHIAGVPLRPKIAEGLHQLYLAKGALATTAIEGNTLSEAEALKQIKGELRLPKSKQYLGQAIKNIEEACGTIAYNLFEKDAIDLSVEEIKALNKIAMKKLPLEDSVEPGEIRIHPVGVIGARYRGVPAAECEYLLNKLCKWLNDEFRTENVEYFIPFGIIKAILAHIYLAWIHPFGDGNGRTARLLEFKILLASGVPTPAAHLLSNFYNETRSEYYIQLSKTSKSGGDVVPFIEYAARGFVDGLRSQLQIIREQQLDIVWRNFIYEKFKDKNRSVEIRQRHLVLDLSRLTDPIPLQEIKNISPRIAAHYANKSERTVYRDINELVKMDLIELKVGGVRPRREKILQFLPYRKIQDS